MFGFKRWKDYFHNYRFHSIFFKNFVLLITLVLVPVICVISISVFSYDHVYKSTEKAYTDEMRTLIFDDVESLFNEVWSKMVILSLDKDVELFFCSTDRNHLNYDDNAIHSLINICKITMDEIDGIYLYATNNGYVYTNTSLLEYEALYQKAYIDRWDPDGEQMQIVSIEAEESGAKSDVLCMYYTVKYNRNAVGVVTVLLNTDRLSKHFLYRDNVSVAFCVDEELVFENQKKVDGDDDKVSPETDLSFSKVLDKYNMNVTIHMNRQPINESISGFVIFSVVLIAAMFLFSAVYAFYISGKVYNPFVTIMAALEEPANINEKEILQNKDELSYIMHAISNSALQKNSIEEELLMRIELLKKAQAVALQAQINPHFINNTLETINWMVVEHLGGNNEISEMLNCLSALMRVSLGSTDTFVTLGEEVAYVKKYLFIQQKRLKGGFDIEWSIPEELTCCRCIRLMLQPLVENAINYGIKPYGAGGKITITASRIGNRLRICVIDSGMGLTPSRVSEINESIRKEVIKESDHIGLSNVNQRIMLAFGEEYGVSLHSQILQGTSVILELPFQTDIPDVQKDV